MVASNLEQKVSRQHNEWTEGQIPFRRRTRKGQAPNSVRGLALQWLGDEAKEGLSLHPELRGPHVSSLVFHNPRCRNASFLGTMAPEMTSWEVDCMAAHLGHNS